VQTGQGAHISGYVQFGGGPLLSEPTDPNIGYPPSAKPLSYQDAFEGFAYTILDDHLTETRLQFSIETSELFKKWCELQTAYQWNAETYRCLPNDCTGQTETGCVIGCPGAEVPVDCRKLALCYSNVCQCSASGCTVAIDAPDVKF